MIDQHSAFYSWHSVWFFVAYSELIKFKPINVWPKVTGSAQVSYGLPEKAINTPILSEVKIVHLKIFLD